MLNWAVFSSAIESAKYWLAKGGTLTEQDIAMLESLMAYPHVPGKYAIGLIVIRRNQQTKTSYIRTLLGLDR